MTTRHGRRDLDTIMTGLACGEPVTAGIDVLANYVDFVASLPVYVTVQGMRVLSSPARGDRPAPTEAEPTDRRVISGESGAAPFGLAHEVLTDPALAGIRDALGIDSESVLLFLSTEGDTDRAGFDAIVHDGAYPHPSAPRQSVADKKSRP